MDPRIEEITRRLGESRAALLSTLGGVPRELWTRPPGEGRWAIVSVLDHLARVESAILGLLRAKTASVAASGEAAAGRPHTVKPELFRDRSRRVVTPEPFEPRPDGDPDALLPDLERLRVASLAFIRSADPDALALVEYPHFVLGVLNGLQWFDFLGAHEARHTAQIVECAEQLRAMPA